MARRLTHNAVEVIVEQPTARQKLVDQYADSQEFKELWTVLERREQAAQPQIEADNVSCAFYNPFLSQSLLFSSWIKKQIRRFHNRKHRERRWEATWWQQFWQLAYRGTRQQFSVIMSPLNIIQMLVIAVVAGLLWLQTPPIEEAIADRYGLVRAFVGLLKC